MREIRLVIVFQRLKPLEHRFCESVIPGKGPNVGERVHPAPAAVHEPEVAGTLGFRCRVHKKKHVAAVRHPEVALTVAFSPAQELIPVLRLDKRLIRRPQSFLEIVLPVRELIKELTAVRGFKDRAELRVENQFREAFVEPRLINQLKDKVRAVGVTLRALFRKLVFVREPYSVAPGGVREFKADVMFIADHLADKTAHPIRR